MLKEKDLQSGPHKRSYPETPKEFGGVLNYMMHYLSFDVAMHRCFSGSPRTAGINQRRTGQAERAMGEWRLFHIAGKS